MKKIRMSEYYNDYKVKDEMDHDLGLLLNHLKRTKPFSKYETKSYYDDESNNYICEVYNISKLRVFEVYENNGNKYMAEINGTDKKICYYLTLMNMQSKIVGKEQISKIRNVKTNKIINIPQIDQMYGKE